ncbi:autotransporter domain-containing protein [Synechococcus sp. HJ21-Hayes]|uniref:autotransporter family protein n=1 Tax=unclassified Synechococcus TaxID=2626047 RepID=UPI0020CC3BC2|nr:MULTISPECIES: autotransporter domain-containing protein [unclassified Synechococcus]MCP9832355.1 autotransporter domain-containing protein [Synechococcus sp. JJ3a-Johnson]MCP9853941.1 autotransporter domain-containing protein [Synechococcus sp. HJ21-Hayes]
MYQGKKVHTSRNKTSKIQVLGKAIKSAALCGLVISIPKLALADTTIINNSVTGTQGPTTPPLNGDDTLTITSSGSVSTSGTSANGINATNGNNRITNIGSINTSGNNSIGANAQGNSNIIINSGLISTSGSIAPGTTGSDGINAIGSFNTILNQGTIRTNGEQSYGISSLGSFNIINNSGVISTYGRNSAGIGGEGNSNTIANTGTISTYGFASDGISLAGPSNANTINNSGTITTTGDSAAGIFVTGVSNTVANSGSISSSGNLAAGVAVVGSSNTVTTSGSIVSKQSYAVLFNGSGNTLNVVNGFLGGRINMGTGGTVNISPSANFSQLLTFEGSVSSINSSGSVPVFINRAAQQAATYDPTIFASSSDALADVTNTVSSLIPGRFNGIDGKHPLWARGFGMTSSYSGTTDTLERHHILSGIAMGYDAKRSKDLTLGLLGGYSQTNLTADGITIQSYNNSSDGGFLGLYGQKRWGDTSVDFALYGGVQSFQQQRFVNDNLAYLGNSSTNSTYQGWWFAPEAGITVNAGDIQGWSVLPTARLRYAQQWMGAYTESGGGSANATVNGRNVAIGQSFVGVGTRRTLKTTLGKNTKMVLEGQVGYMYRGVVGDDTVGVTLIGQSLSVPTEAVSRNAIAVSAGVTIDLSNAVALKIRGDAAAGNGINYVGGGWAGLSVKF